MSDDGADPDRSASGYGRGSSVSAAWAWLTRIVEREDDWACWSGMTEGLRRSWCERPAGPALQSPTGGGPEVTADQVIDSLVSEGPLSDHWTAVGAVVLDAVRSTLTLPTGGWESLGAGSRSQPLGVGLELVCVFDHGDASSALLGRPGATGVLPDAPDSLPVTVWVALTMQHDFDTGAWQVAALDHDHPGALRPAEPRQRG